MRTALLLCSCFLLSIFTFAQRTYKKAVIFKTSGDSVQCFVNDKEWLENPTEIAIKKTEAGEKQNLSITEIKRIVIENGDRYQAAYVKIDNTPAEFTTPYIDPKLVKTDEATVLLLLEYEASPFKLFSLRRNDRMHIYLQKNEDDPEELIYRKIFLTKDGDRFETEDKTFIKQIDNMLAGCEKASSRASNASYSTGEIAAVLKLYNTQCAGGHSIQYVNNGSPKAKLAFTIIAGISTNKPVFTSTNSLSSIPLQTTNPLKTDPSFSAGIRFNYIIGRLHQKLALLADVYYNSFTATVTEYKSYTSPALYTKKTLTLNPSLIRTGLMARYHFLNGPLRPFLQGGFAASFTISHKESVVYDDFYNNQSHITTENPYEGIEYKKMQLGYILGAGIAYNRFSIDYKFEPTSGSVNLFTVGSTVKTNTILLGFRINKR